MKIKSLIRRAGGSTVQMGTAVYRFTPENDHTCVVEDEVHIERLLSVSTFKEADANDVAPTADKADAKQGEGLDAAKSPAGGDGATKAESKPRQPRQTNADKAKAKQG